jgi:tRNA threonylcarbamoyladenosine biosynthesis protein TsaE
MDSKPDSASGSSPRAVPARTEQSRTGTEPDSAPGPSPRTLRVPTDTAMRELGRELAGKLRAGDLVILSGPLGAGKTTLVQGIGAGLRVRGPITSPTFVIARVHPRLAGDSGTGPPLVHADAYRLGSVVEVDDLDLDTDSAVTVVEWGRGLVEELAEDRLEISIEPDSEGDARTVRITGHGARWSCE